MEEKQRETSQEARVLSPAELSDYDGVTIEAETNESSQHIRAEQERPRYYRTYVRYGGSGWGMPHWLNQGGWQGWLARTALLVGGVALGIFLLGVILPVLFTVAGMAIAAWLIWQLIH